MEGECLDLIFAFILSMCVHRCMQYYLQYCYNISILLISHHNIPTPQWGNLPAQHLPTNLHPSTWQHVPQHQIESPSRWPFLVETHWIESIEWPRGGGCVRCCWVYSWLLFNVCWLWLLSCSCYFSLVWMGSMQEWKMEMKMDGGEAGSFWRASKKIQIFLSVKGVPILSNLQSQSTTNHENSQAQDVKHYNYLTPW